MMPIKPPKNNTPHPLTTYPAYYLRTNANIIKDCSKYNEAWQYSHASVPFSDGKISKKCPTETATVTCSHGVTRFAPEISCVGGW